MLPAMSYFFFLDLNSARNVKQLGFEVRTSGTMISRSGNYCYDIMNGLFLFNVQSWSIKSLSTLPLAAKLA